MPPLFFEGTEKKIELLVDPTRLALRSLGREYWESVVERSRATVLSVRSTARCDAYLLSESSLFVADDQVTMITCGRTRLADAATLLLDRVPDEAIRYLIYQRRNDYFPERQPSTFLDDARVLSERIGGTALRFGDQDDHYIYLFTTDRAYEPEPSDATLEVLMHGVDEETMRRFTTAPAAGGDPGMAAAILGADLAPFEVDEHYFSPPGYSLNAIRDHVYYTLHATREEFGSYVSFETNDARSQDPTGIVGRLVEFFRPRSFDLFSFVPAADQPASLHDLPYDVRDHVEHVLPSGYRVTFQHRFRPPGEPRRPLEVEL